MKNIMLVALLMSASSVAFSADLSKTCEDYYAAMDSHLEMTAANEAMKPQLDAIKGQYEESKKQILAMPVEQQNTVCKAGLDALAQAKKMMADAAAAAAK